MCVWIVKIKIEKMTNFKYIKIQQIRLHLISLKQSIFLTNPTAFSRNTKQRSSYCEALSSLLGGLIPFQKYALLGLLLSDASLQASSSGKTFRLKMQQSVKHAEFVNHILNDVIPEWVVKTNPQQASAKRTDMLEIQTLTHEAFSFFTNLISIPLLSFNSYQVVPKVFGEGIIRWLHPITIAYWFMGDGGKESSRKLFSSKGIQLHTQGFDYNSNQILADSLKRRYGWDIALKPERDKPNQYFIEISPKSYDSFIEHVGPFIHPSMSHKLPAPRSYNSRFGHMNEALFNRIVSSFFK